MILKADLKVCLGAPSQVAVERPDVPGNFARVYRRRNFLRAYSGGLAGIYKLRAVLLPERR